MTTNLQARLAKLEKVYAPPGDPMVMFVRFVRADGAETAVRTARCEDQQFWRGQDESTDQFKARVHAAVLQTKSAARTWAHVIIFAADHDAEEPV